MCTGEYRRHKGAEATRLLFVDVRNACRSQMAEAIANSLDQPQFIFASAGTDPAPPDPVTLRFLKEKGLEVSHHTSKGLNQIPNLDHYQIIVALAEEAKTAFPKPPTKTICLDWSVPDPSMTKGSEAEVTKAYEQTFQFLQSQIQDLVKAVLGEKTTSSESH
jgi:arsenate reductase